MKKRYWIILLFVLTLGALKLYLNKSIVKCPPMHPDYFKLFPYHKNDTLYFKNADSLRTYYVKSFVINQRERYDSNLKCGCCEDGIYLSLIGIQDTIELSLSNYRNPNSCLGGVTFFKRNGKPLKKLKPFKYESFSINKINGIDSIKFNDKIWIFDKKIKGNKEITKSTNDC